MISNKLEYNLCILRKLDDGLYYLIPIIFSKAIIISFPE